MTKPCQCFFPSNVRMDELGKYCPNFPTIGYEF